MLYKYLKAAFERFFCLESLNMSCTNLLHKFHKSNSKKIALKLLCTPHFTKKTNVTNVLKLMTFLVKKKRPHHCSLQYILKNYFILFGG